MTEQYIAEGLENANKELADARAHLDYLENRTAPSATIGMKRNAWDNIEFWSNKAAFFASQVGRAEH